MKTDVRRIPYVVGNYRFNIGNLGTRALYVYTRAVFVATRFRYSVDIYVVVVILYKTREINLSTSVLLKTKRINEL